MVKKIYKIKKKTVLPLSQNQTLNKLCKYIIEI